MSVSRHDVVPPTNTTSTAVYAAVTLNNSSGNLVGEKYEAPTPNSTVQIATMLRLAGVLWTRTITIIGAVRIKAPNMADM